MNKYAGIGSRNTPFEIYIYIQMLAMDLAYFNYTLRSGGADNADTAFEKGCDFARGNKEIFLPWKGYNNNSSLNCCPSTEAIIHASEFHPAWFRCKQAVQKLHGRNAHIILGENLHDPVDFVICWCDPKKQSGTKMGISIAEAKGIPVYNLFEKRWKIEDMIEKNS